ncbi:MAG: metal-dependent phosphohydrolase, partial [Cyanobacteria bacterium J06636_28]
FDIANVKGVCREDRDLENRYSTGKGDMVELPPGATDASLTPHHVDRGKLFVEERFGNNQRIDATRIKNNIELTRFPVPKEEDHQDTSNYPGLIRAADLIGQLSDPRYLKKISALFYEFEETGQNKELKYESPHDLRSNYPKFYWNVVHHYIHDSLRYLALTQEGKQIIANLYSNVFMVEYEQDLLPW